MQTKCNRWVRLGCGLLLGLLASGAAWAQAPGAGGQTPPTALIVVIEPPEGGGVQVLRRGATVWDRAYTNQVLYAGDQVRTDARSRALLRFSDLETVALDARTQVRIEGGPPRRRGFNLFRGIISFFHRDRPDDFEVGTPAISSLIRGTEFHLAVADDGTSTLTLFDGEVELRNESGQLTLQTGQAGQARPGQAPTRTAFIEAVNLLQWRLYYPGVLDLEELSLSDAKRQALRESLAAYQSGDLLGALARYPEGRIPASAAERLYRAAVGLSVGRVEETEQLLRGPEVSATRNARQMGLADAMGKVVAAVKGQAASAARKAEAAAPGESSTAWLAESYAQQSLANLEQAREAARRAVELSPKFAFGWSRLAEMEFSFGRTSEAEKALDRSLELAPRNAQALALKGFLAAARHRTREAIGWFDRAIAIDGGLGNAWLGRGLCCIREGRSAEGRNDLQVAATLEPQRAVFRSYLGKAFSQVRDARHARQELDLAVRLDPNDPTAFLYRALLNQQQNRPNEAVRDLEHSQELNDNRRVYRSSLLLDQDQAVRGANLATVYRDAGMTEVSLREAGRAVSLDYANYSAHLFLADSYNELRDPRQINLRYETPWLTEYLVANLLAPPAAGTLSPFVTQQEYARLFERNRFGFSSATDYSSDGDWLQTAAQHGLYENFSYAAEMVYRSQHGYRPNQDFEQIIPTLRLKYQFTPQDSVFFQATYYDAEGGDVRPLYDQSQANPFLRTRETHEPLLLAGLRHHWSPGVDTLLLGGWVNAEFTVTDPMYGSYLVAKRPDGSVQAVVPGSVGLDYQSEAHHYTVELQQIVQRPPHTFIVGGRYQGGEFDTRAGYTVTPDSFVNDFGDPVFVGDFDEPPQRFVTDMERLTAYGYYYLQPIEPLVLIAGLSYDRLSFPENFRFPPLTGGEETEERLSPKAGFVWTPHRSTTVRFAYGQSLGGVAFDQSFRLEPSQLAGFNQAFRSLIPEAVEGANSGARFETFGLALDEKFSTGTYLGLTAELLRSPVDRVVGVFDRLPGPGPIAEPSLVESSTRQSLDYCERTFTATLNQLLSEEWSVGVRYRLSHADLERQFLDLPSGVPAAHGFRPEEDLSALLHQVNFYVLFTHPSGFFGQAGALWTQQSNDGYSPALPGDEFWQFNVFAGYRFPRRRAEIRVGILNLGDQDYHLNPLNLITELPHHRTVVASLRFSF
jgi:Tfp pilus assembly protein PilF